METREKSNDAIITRAEKERRFQARETGANLKFLKSHAADLHLTCNIPQFIIDTYMSQMSATVWKFFTYLSRCATFDPSDPHFGLCWRTHEEIQRVTGIRKWDMKDYQAVLEDLGLLRTKTIRKNEGQGVITIHRYEVTFFKIRDGRLS